jgi:hypothetical protein
MPNPQFANPQFDELVARYPQVQQDRYGLAFAGDVPASQIADELSRQGVVMLRNVLPASILWPCHWSFARFVRSLKLDRRSVDGSWHRPWLVRHWGHRPAAVILAALFKSWAWRVVEKICGSTDIAVLLGLCIARHAIDKPLGAGAHQDARAVAPDVPFSMWIPLHGIAPRRNSGLGFIVPAPDRVLPSLPHNDIGPDYVLGNFDRAWVPPYSPGDVSIHTSLSPHFTTGYGTHTNRYSFEVRAMARDAAPAKYHDPAVYVGRREGRAMVVDTNCSAGSDAHPFLSQFL